MLVTGGTGNLGRHVLPHLQEAGVNPRVLTRSPRSDSDGVVFFRGDTVKGDNLAEAVAGMETVLHLAGGAKGDDVAARNIAAAAKAAGVEHLVLISVVGADHMPIGYFRAKARAEEEFANSGVPYSIVRAAQFHDFILKTIGSMAKLPFVPLPSGLRFEPVDVSEVAAYVAEIALREPSGRARDIAGPAVMDVEEIVRPLLKLRQRRFRPLRVPLSGAIGRAYKAGDNLALPGVMRGGIPWSEYLVARAAVEQKV
ncbi:SDR family oxidoreductase [Agromyces silvae]|uniref:SDR family oxidoreductase n=1 Tax=Agromyces silvae TaxID=3388266 RepID=UPI00280BDB38|nr:SDR family oxidoreductase [Agromyces protaetiae]